ncbi:hypothetical protein SEA_DANFORTH_48 [Mycobacterium phage Danforth]|uniref:Uncharacterized protein n=2 Tax=Fromanvirus TaxID=186764 RepID=G8IRC6_9CAUD|nr:hypothetical protein V424_gp062 [Mycobacterium phage Fredward]YP_009204139.1 hypothetical protein AVT31_gp058 [Mycobacterium phage Smeadley]YP_009638308.1 hypothetical protein FGG39_gp59 [Mycobacterium phage Saintus]QBI96643.1 hypothetical protein SEA_EXPELLIARMUS_48 [Mycobacterium phage Expelliarmus]QHB36941.1 hypothetical protein SEA_ROARY_49 [Mycobacterium phage Roary]QJD50151.1 hypothetical protein SEA_DANFORTH_48 [Mycobacterium phage Danforth]WNO26734.1 hypothetical protein SEA_GROUND
MTQVTEIAREIVIDHLTDGIEFLSVAEHWLTEELSEDELKEIHGETWRILLMLVGKVALV